MIGFCLGLAGGAWVSLPLHDFKLAWQHSIEKIRWEEDLLAGAAQQGRRRRGFLGLRTALRHGTARGIALTL